MGAGDRIIAVNGAYGTSEILMKELQASEVLRLVLVRIEAGQKLDDWEYVKSYQGRLDLEENAPPPVYQLVPHHGEQVVDLSFGDAVSGQIMSGVTVMPESFQRPSVFVTEA